MGSIFVRGAGCAAISCSMLAGSLAQAEPAPSGSPALDTVVVTATRTDTPLDSSLAPVTVLTQDDIAERQVLSLQDLIEGEVGVQVSNNGGLGKVSSVFVRGANADQVLVLVDGVRMGSATLGTTQFQYLPVDQIDRVEIVRGPLSSLYGSEAMGGVIQIFTRRPSAEGTQIDAEAAAGSHRTTDIGGSVGAVDGPMSFGLSVSNLSSDGYRNCTGTPPTAAVPFGGGCFVDDPDADGYHSVSGSVRFRYQIADGSDVEALALRASGGTRYAGPANDQNPYVQTNHEAFVEQVASVAAHWSPLPALKFTAQVGQSRDNEVDTLNGVEPPGYLFDTARDTGSLQADWHVTPTQLLTLGSDEVRDRIASDNDFPVTSRNIEGVFGEYQGAWGANQVTMSARHDSNSQFGDKTTGSAAWGYRFTDGPRLTASFGTAFHAPTFNDLYYPYFGNPALRPESSRSVDIGLDQRLSSAAWSVHGYETRVHDLITYDAVLFAPENTDEARIRGVEVTGSAKAGPWSAEITGTWLDARNRTPGSADDGNLLPRRPRAMGRIEAARQWGAVRAALRVYAAGPTFEDLANTQGLGGYSTADALVDWAPARHWTVQAKLANLTGHRYQTALYYPQDGRTFLLSLRYRSERP